MINKKKSKNSRIIQANKKFLRIFILTLHFIFERYVRYAQINQSM